MDEAQIELVLLLGKALHRYGVDARRLENTLIQVSEKLGLEAQFFSTPTSILAAFGPHARERTSLVRVEPGDLDLEKLAQLHTIAAGIVDGTISPTDASARVKAVIDAKPRYKGFEMTACTGLAAGSAAIFFAGGPLEVLISLGIGMVVGVISTTSVRRDGLARILEPLAATVASTLGVVAARFIPGVSAYVVTLAGIIALLPGLTITTAMTELATRHLASGTARLAGALVHLLGLGFGVALGTRLGTLFSSTEPTPHVDTLWPLWALGLAVLVAGLAFLVLVRARPADAPWVVLSAFVAFTGSRAGAESLGPELGAFLGALLVAAGSNLYARVFDRPASVPLVPGILLLVPGSIGFRSVFSMLERDVVPAVDAAFKMIAVAIALVAGLLVANAALPTRRTL
jgi:uncharacterized membrane protein YjjP (DUF1212 family)